MNHSPANTKKAYAQALSLFDVQDPDFEARVTRSERDPYLPRFERWTIIRGPELRRMRLSTGSRRAHVLNVGITRVV